MWYCLWYCSELGSHEQPEDDLQLVSRWNHGVHFIALRNFKPQMTNYDVLLVLKIPQMFRQVRKLEDYCEMDEDGNCLVVPTCRQVISAGTWSLQTPEQLDPGVEQVTCSFWKLVMEQIKNTKLAIGWGLLQKLSQPFDDLIRHKQHPDKPTAWPSQEEYPPKGHRDSTYYSGPPQPGRRPVREASVGPGLDNDMPYQAFLMNLGYSEQEIDYIADHASEFRTTFDEALAADLLSFEQIADRYDKIHNKYLSYCPNHDREKFDFENPTDQYMCLLIMFLC